MDEKSQDKQDGEFRELGNEIEVIEPPSARYLPALRAEQNLEAAVQQAENLLEFSRQVILISLKHTKHNWLNIGGKPYLDGAGCSTLLHLWGIYWKQLEIEPSLKDATELWQKDIPVAFEVSGELFSKRLMQDDESIWIYGGRSSADEFFARKGRPMSQIDILDVRKAARTNWIQRAVTTLLGLRGMTWEDLAEYGIVARGQVQFRGQQQAKTQAPPAPPAEKPPTGTSSVLSLDEKRRSIEDYYVMNEAAPDKAIAAETKGAIPRIEDLANAKAAYIDKLFDRVCPATKP